MAPWKTAPRRDFCGRHGNDARSRQYPAWRSCTGASCWMGDLAVMTARRVGLDGFVLATDISTSMLNLAAEAAREAGFTNVETRVMDAEISMLRPILSM